MAELALTPGAAADRSWFEVPGDFAPAPAEPPALALDRLADDVWLVSHIGGADYRSLVVVHDDGLVVLETPQSEPAMRAVLDLLRAELPGVPVKVAAVTHHHFDHAGGVRALMAAGARIYVPRGTEQLFDSIAWAPRTLQREAAALDPWSLRIEGVVEATLAAASRGPAVHLLPLPGIAHSDPMLFAWIPERGILFQGDLFVRRGEAPEPAPPQAVALLAVVEERGLALERLVGVHGAVATLDDLRHAVRLRAAAD
jgi:glyoxylase-like metal-dependent hydrolase (beta-lactamase superfamily II)